MKKKEKKENVLGYREKCFWQNLKMLFLFSRDNRTKTKDKKWEKFTEVWQELVRSEIKQRSQESRSSQERNSQEEELISDISTARDSKCLKEKSRSTSSTHRTRNKQIMCTRQLLKKYVEFNVHLLIFLLFSFPFFDFSIFMLYIP